MHWIVFDYGEVISRRPATFTGLATMLGGPAEPFEAAYWEFRDAYDRGLPDLDYWSAVGARVGAEVDAELAAALTEADIEAWLSTDPDVLDLLGELAEDGAGLALLSNAAATHGEVFRRQPWAGHFRHILISGDLGTAKPDPEIWRALVGRLGTEASRCLFLDDKPVNIAGARTAGLRAELWTDAATARCQIADFRRPGRRSG